MARLPAQLKRGFLQAIYDSVEDETASVDLVSDEITRSVLTLEQALKAFSRMGFQSLKTGLLTLGSAGYAHEVKFAAPDYMRAMNQDEVMALAQEFREIYTAAKATLIAGGNATPTDAQIMAEMMDADSLQSITSTWKDHTGLRL